MAPVAVKLLLLLSFVTGYGCLPTKDQELEALLMRLRQGSGGGTRYENMGHAVRNLDALGGGHLLRQTRGIDSLSGVGFGTQKRFDSMSGVTFGGNKRSFETELSMSGGHPRSGKYIYSLPYPKGSNGYFDKYVDKKNFDEIDRAGFDSFVKKNFDEIDRSGFNSFSKKNIADFYPLGYNRYYENDRTDDTH